MVRYMVKMKDEKIMNRPEQIQKAGGDEEDSVKTGRLNEEIPKNGGGRGKVERKYQLKRDIITAEEGDKWRENTN